MVDIEISVKDRSEVSKNKNSTISTYAPLINHVARDKITILEVDAEDYPIIRDIKQHMQRRFHRKDPETFNHMRIIWIAKRRCNIDDKGYLMFVLHSKFTMDTEFSLREKNNLWEIKYYKKLQVVNTLTFENNQGTPVTINVRYSTTLPWDLFYWSQKDQSHVKYLDLYSLINNTPKGKVVQLKIDGEKTFVLLQGYLYKVRLSKRIYFERLSVDGNVLKIWI